LPAGTADGNDGVVAPLPVAQGEEVDAGLHAVVLIWPAAADGCVAPEAVLDALADRLGDPIVTTVVAPSCRSRP
jgi:hypothetical protein